MVILPTGGGKSQVFMVPALLPGAGITIVVAPYAELKRQLVTLALMLALPASTGLPRAIVMLELS